MPGAAIALFTKWPAPGLAKTRLIPALGAKGATELHRKLVERTLAAVRDSGLPFELRVTGAPVWQFHQWLGEDLTIVDQGGGDLGARLTRVPAPALLIGSDAPDVTGTLLRKAAQALLAHDAVFGPAADGGYWLLGLARPMPDLFTDMPWGTDAVGAETLSRLAECGVNAAILPILHDCDRPEDLARWPGLTA